MTQQKKKTQVIVRTYSAGVHYGTLSRRRGQEVELTDARRIWSWAGANTLHEMALTGLDQSRSRVSVAVSRIVLTEAIEVIECTSDAARSIEGAIWRA